jgi:amino acid transporter
VGTVGVLVLQAAVALVVVVFFWRTKLDRRVWHTVVAPLLGAAGLLYAIVMAIDNFDVLTGSASDVVNGLYWLIPIVAVVGFGVGTWRTGRGADLEAGFAADPPPAVETPVGDRVAVG